MNNNTIFPSFSVILVFLSLSVIGFGLLPLLSLQWLPSGDSASITVWFSWANTSPEIIEQEVITPLEGAFSLVPGVKKIYATARTGGGNIKLEVDQDTEIDFFRFEIASKIRQLYKSFPQGVSFPTISLNNPEEEIAERPILTYSITGNADASSLYQYCKEILSPQLALIDGLERIEVAGGDFTEFRIIYQSAKITSLGINENDILEAIESAFTTRGLGIVKERNAQFSIRLNNTFNQNKNTPSQTIQALLNIPIAKINQKIVYLKDLSTVAFKETPSTAFYRINGKNSIRLLFYPNSGTNTIDLSKKVKQNIGNLASKLPTSYQLILEDDATVYLAEELKKITQRTFLSLGILFLFTLLIYRSWKYLVIVFISTGCNLGLAFILYYIFNIELHLYALSGITISFGMMIDNSIVMMHHLRHQNNLKVFPALLAATLTTIAPLIVVWFLPVKWQINLLAFAQVICINLVVSLVVAFFLIPALMQSFYKNKSLTLPSKSILRFRRFHYFYKGILSALVRRKGIIIGGTILLFGLPVFLLPNSIQNWEWYNKTLGNEWYVENVKPTVNKVLGGTLRLFMWYVYEGSTYREADETALYVQASMPPGATIEQLNGVFEQLENYLSNYELEIKQFTTQINSGQNGQIEIYFNDGYNLAFPHQLKARLVSQSLNLGGIKWNIFGVGKGFSNDSGGSTPSFSVAMYGYNKEQLAKQAQRFADKLLVHPRIQEVNTEANMNWWEKDIYEYTLETNSLSMATQGISSIELLQILNTFNQFTYSDYYLPNGEAVRLISDATPTNNLWILNNAAQQLDSMKFSFPTFAQLHKQKVRSSIHKENQQYIRMIEFEYTGSARFGQKYLDEVITQMRKEMPLGYTIKEQNWTWGKEEQKQYALIGLGIALIFMICAIMFESFRQAFAILTLIPISFIGIFLTFYWFDFPFDQGGYTSFVLLSGNVVNSLILLVNDFNYYKKLYPNKPSLTLYVKAIYQKAVPIFLTIISTILGLIPFFIYGETEVFWFSLAVGTSGGMIFSLFVIGILLPVFFIRPTPQP